MEDITIVYRALRKRVLLINQIIKIIKRESTFLVKTKKENENDKLAKWLRGVKYGLWSIWWLL